MRTRRAVAIATGVAAVLLAYYAISWAQVTPSRERGTDFSASYVAALLLRSGDGSQLYDQQVERARHLELLPAGTVINLPFITPPTTALLALPFTALDPGTAFRVWSMLELLLLVLAVWIAIRAGPWPALRARARRMPVVLMALAGGGTFAFLLLGQIDGFAALGLAAAYASWRGERSATAGFWLGLAFAATKPHLAIGLAIWLFARRDWRALAGASTGCALVAAVSLALVGPSGIGDFVSALGFAYGNTPVSSTLGVPGLIGSWFGGGTLPAVIGITGASVALAGCAVLGARSRRGSTTLEVSLAGAVALSLVASPHLLAHDLVILAPVFAWCAARAATVDVTPWPGTAALRMIGAWAILGLVTLLDTGNSAPAPPGRLVPLVLLAVGAAALVITGSRSVAGRPARIALAQSGSGRGAGGSTA
ncbi:MAG TPA: glycosyltransferase family 87 protein [Candidatus Saccharimonadales bacterium]|nr:glycosyltransferase family 87 protein [Candidatus Saccharimonadales bacterium]